MKFPSPVSAFLPALVIACLALLAEPHCHAADMPKQLPGFVGIPWGTDPDNAKKALMSRTHGHYDHAHTTPTEVAFLGGRFAGFKVARMKLMFSGNAFWGTEFYLEAPSARHEKEFASIKAMLTEKYGKPDRDEAVGDGLEANWYFPVTGAPSANLWIIQDPHGDSLKVMYLNEATKKAAGAAAAAQPAKPAKAPSTTSAKTSDKDDL